jgi:hypothetical protein
LQNGSVTAPKIATSNNPGNGQVLSYTGSGLAWSAPSSNPPLGGDLTGTVSNAQIAAGVVGSPELADGAVTTPKIANGAITADKLATGIGTTSNTGLGSLLIFYSPPNIMNGRYSDDYAAGVIARHTDVILGSGLQQSGNPYHASTVAIIQKVAALGTGTTCWGYIDLGIINGSSNLSISTLQTQIDEWIAIGATGIFCDLVGYDYGVSRDRQNTIINYIHGKGVGAFLNVWNIDDLLSPAYHMTFNPGSTPTAANSTDSMLLESWICNSDAYGSPYFATFSDIKTRGDKAVAYRSSMGIRLLATSIYSHSNHTAQELRDMYEYTNAFARIWRLDGSGLAASNYGSTGIDIGVVKPMFSELRSTPLRPNAPYSLNNTWTQADATDIGLSVIYDPGTSTYTWSQD